MSSPEKVIEAIRNSFIGASQVYTNGSCIMFYFFLKTIYPKALPYWSKEERHMITKIGNKYYDINGVVTNTAGYELDSEKYSSFPIAVAFPERREKRVRYANAKRMY